MKKLFRLLSIGLTAASLSVTGCGLDQHPAYSAKVKYGVRTDPIIKGTTAALGDERFDPDRPGQFPLMSIADALKPDQPFYAKAKDAAPDTLFRDPTAISAKDRDDLDKALEKMFGTPAEPIVNAAEADIAAETITALKLDKETLAKGSTRYRIHCLHCHGVPGDGRGPTARWINPHPRDFRSGKFKFASVNQVGVGRPPSRADLLRTLRSGLEGTAMPAFNLLADDELESLVSYVIHLSIRGNVEQNLMRNDFTFEKEGNKLKWTGEDDDGGPATPWDQVKTATKALVEKSRGRANVSWLASQDPVNWIKVEPYPFEKDDMEALKKSVKRGKEMFEAKPSPEYVKEYSLRLPKEIDQQIKTAAEAYAAGKKLTPAEAAANLDSKRQERAPSTLKTPNCVSCHVDFGRQAKYRFDEWGTLVRPNNFTVGVFRGGKRPVDMYYRIHSGITPSGMTNFGGTLQGQDIWDLVNFVSTASFPGMRDKLGIAID